MMSKSSQLYVIIDTDSFNRFQNIIDHLEKLQFTIEKEKLGENIIQIPPNGGVLILNSQSINGKTRLSVIDIIIKKFFNLIPNGVIIFEGYNRIGTKKREFVQNLVLNHILKPDFMFNGVIPTRNSKETALCIKSITRREQVEDLPPKLSRVKNRAPYLADAQIFFIEGLLQCGTKKAKSLLNAFDTPQEIINTILNCPEKILEIKGFGKKFIEINQKLLKENLL